MDAECLHRSLEGFDVNACSAEFIDDPYPTYRKLRDEYPVHRNPDGSVLLTRYDDVRQLLASRHVSSLKDGVFRKSLGGGSTYEHHTNVMVFRDPPQHGNIRRVVSRSFTPPAVKQFGGQVEAVVRRLLQSALGKREFDLVEDFSFLLPVSVIADLLGVPLCDHPLFLRWSAAISRSLEPSVTPEFLAHADHVIAEMKAYFAELAAVRRRQPGDDLMTMLVRAADEDRRISEDELLHNAAFLLAAGHETTSSLIGGGVVALMCSPDQAARLSSNPGLAERAVEEFLRYDSPNQLGGRITTEKLSFHGVEIEAGTFVWISNGAANRDERTFHEPERLDIARDPNCHLAFGHGLHLCLGAALARLEGACAFRELAAVLPRLQLNGVPARRGRARHRGFASIPMKLH